jgi:HK97 family phage major capsid protein
VDLVHSITQPYRSGALFIGSDNVVKNLRKLRDDSGGAGVGAPLWQPSMTAGVPDTVLGYSLITDPNVPTGQTNGTKGLIFGNINKALAIRFAGPVRVEASTDFAFDTDLTVWRFIVRMDSEMIDAAAAKVLTYTT